MSKKQRHLRSGTGRCMRSAVNARWTVQAEYLAVLIARRNGRYRLLLAAGVVLTGRASGTR